MAIDTGFNGGSFRPVPTSNKPTLRPRPIPSSNIGQALAGHEDYIPSPSTPTSSQIISSPLPQYSSVARVVQAYLDRATTGLTYNQAHQILMNQFGFSDNDATDALGVEAEVIVNPPLVVPVEEPVEESQVTVTEPIYELGPKAGGVTMVRIVGIAVLYYTLAALNKRW